MCQLNLCAVRISLLKYCAIYSEVEEPFSLHFIVAARHTNTLLRDGLAKIGIWPITASTAPISTKSTEKLPIAGFTCLNFENKMDVLDQGVSRFRLTKPIDKSSNRWLNIELLIDIKVEEVLPAVVHQFPWSYTTELSATSSYQSTDMEDIVACDPKELLVSQEFCRQGDYLTLYTRGLAHPVSTKVMEWRVIYLLKKSVLFILLDLETLLGNNGGKSISFA